MKLNYLNCRAFAGIRLGTIYVGGLNQCLTMRLSYPRAWGVRLMNYTGYTNAERGGSRRVITNHNSSRLSILHTARQLILAGFLI